jgi:hypothetical protein
MFLLREEQRIGAWEPSEKPYAFEKYGDIRYKSTITFCFRFEELTQWMD